MYCALPMTTDKHMSTGLSLRHIPARVTIMKSTKLQQDYGLGQHTAWERYAHRLENIARGNEKAFTSEERSNAIEAFIRQHPQKAGDIVVCEICVDKIELEKSTGAPAFEDNADVRKMLRERGVFAGVRRPVSTQHTLTPLA